MPLVMLKSDPRARLKPCLRCGYSLRNVPDARACPECGLAIWITLGGNDELGMSNPAWLRRVALGAVALAASNLALIGGVIVGWLFGQLVTSPAVVPRSYVFLMSMSLVAHLTLGAAGLAVLGASEGRYPERAGGLRRAVLAGAGAAAALAVWLVAWQMAHVAPRPPNFLIVVVALGQAAAGWAYLAAVAERIPSRRLVKLSRGLLIATGIAVASLIFRGSYWLFLIMIVPWSRPALPWTLFILIYPPIAAATLIYLARTFRRCAAEAETNWGREGG